MEILSVTLRDFKSYERATVEFREWTNAIIGANGSGKSTILEAIGLALFNRRPVGKLDQLIREGQKSATISVSLVSSFDERVYVIERRIPGTAHYRVHDLDLDNAVVAEGRVGVGEWVRDHLRLEPETNLADLFQHSIGVAQGTIAEPFRLRRSDRKKVFDPILHVQEYRRAADNLLEASRELGEKRHALANDLARMSGELQQLDGLLIARVDLSAEVSELGAQRDVTAGQIEQAVVQLVTLDERERALRRADGRYQTLLRQQGIAAQKLTDTAVRLDEAQRAQKIAGQAEPGHKAYLKAERMQRQLDDERRKQHSYQQAISRLETQRERATAEAEGLKRQLGDLDLAESRAAAVRPQADRYAALQSDLPSLQDRAHQYQRAVERQHDLRAEVEAACLELRRITTESTRADDLERSRARFAKQYAQAQRQEGECDTRARVIASEQSRIHKQSAQLRQSDDAQCPVCEAELTPLHKGELLARNRDQIAQLGQEREKALADKQTATDELARLRQHITDIDRTIRGLPKRTDIERAKTRQADAQDRLAVVNAQVSSLTGSPDRLRQAQEEISSLRAIAAEYHAIQTRLSDRPGLRKRLNAAEQQRTEAEHRLANGMQKMAQFADLDDRHDACLAALASHRGAHQAYLANAQQAGQVEPMRCALAELSSSKEALDAKCALAEKQHAALAADYDQETHVRARDRLAALRASLASTQATLRTRIEQLENAECTISQLQQLADEMVVKQSAHDRVVDMSDTLERSRQLLRDAGPYITEQLVCSISRDASQLYAEIMDNHRGHIEWGNDYELTLSIGGHERAFHQLSGGEQMTAALAVRLAMLRQLSNVGIAFFDEPTANLDPERRQLLAEQITRVGEKEWFRQIFVITHDDSFEAAAANDIHVFKDERGSHIVGDTSADVEV